MKEVVWERVKKEKNDLDGSRRVERGYLCLCVMRAETGESFIKTLEGSECLRSCSDNEVAEGGGGGGGGVSRSTLCSFSPLFLFQEIEGGPSTAPRARRSRNTDRRTEQSPHSCPAAAPFFFRLERRHREGKTEEEWFPPGEKKSH
jgi:hypothetical protein